MKQSSNKQWQRATQAWFALLLYSIAQGPVDTKPFTSILEQICGNRIKNTDIDSSVLARLPTHVDFAKLVKKKRFKRKSDELRHAYQQYAKEINQSPDDAPLTIGDIVNGWADLTGQDRAEFTLKVGPNISSLIETNDLNSRAKQDPENDQTEAAFKFMEDTFLILMEETPQDKQDALVAQIKDAILNNSFHSDIDLPDELFNFGSRLLISEVVAKMDSAFSINPAAKELLLQPLLGALIEIEAKKYGWESGVPEDNVVKLQAELQEKNLRLNKRALSRSLKALDRRSVFLNIDSALEGRLVDDLRGIAEEQSAAEENKTHSTWVSETISPEAESEAEKRVMEWLYRRNCK